MAFLEQASIEAAFHRLQEHIVPQHVKDENEESLLEKTQLTLKPSSIVMSKLTCSELKTVKSQAKTANLEPTAKKPNTQVTPSKGSSTTLAFTAVLKENKIVTRPL